MKTYDNDGHHFVTANGTVVAYTRCWKWQKRFQEDSTTKERTDKMLQSNLAAITLEISEGGASGMEHSSTRHGAQPTATATNRPDRPTGLCHNRVSGPTGRSPLPFPSPPTKAG